MSENCQSVVALESELSNRSKRKAGLWMGGCSAREAGRVDQWGEREPWGQKGLDSHL